MSSPERLKVGIVGSGAVGCYYGAMLAASGQDVHFLMRADLDAVRSGGLKIERENREPLLLNPVQAYATTREIGPCDLVIIALKTTANECLHELLPPLLDAGTMILTLQNGLAIAGGAIDTEAILAQPGLRKLATFLMKEVQAIARAAGHEIEDDFLQRQLDVTYPMGPYKPSSLIDFELGREVEMEAIWGEAVRRAEALGVEAPRLQMLYWLLCSLQNRLRTS